jgi:polyphosphate kinase 2 (PPK2 family)
MERLLVERVMRLTPKSAIRKSYAELRGFEWLLDQHGIVIVKCWLDITHEEQGRRFAERHEERTWKVSTSDDVAREHWPDYTKAANEMIHRTGTSFAPWHIISSEDKRYSRVMVLSTVNQELRRRLGR